MIGQFLLRFLVGFGVFLAIDMVWLGLIARDFYRKQIGFLMAETVNWAAALSFYVLYIVGVLALVVYPALEKGGVNEAIWRGALFGLVCYATYDLTNLATLKNWPLFMTLVDLVWGTVLTASVAGGSVWIIQRFGL